MKRYLKISIVLKNGVFGDPEDAKGECFRIIRLLETYTESLKRGCPRSALYDDNHNEGLTVKVDKGES